MNRISYFGKSLYLLSALILALALFGVRGSIEKAFASGDAIEVSQPSPLTDSPRHDRNASLLKASDGKWWLFFARGEGDPPPPNPDSDKYDICWITSTDNGVTWSDDTDTNCLEVPDAQGIGGFSPAAVEVSSGTIWLFYNSGDNYYFAYSGGTWTGPTALPSDANGTTSSNHLDAIKTSDGKIWLFYLGNPSNAIYARTYDGSSWSSSQRVSDGSLAYTATPKAI
jgi:hypothetical protein